MPSPPPGAYARGRHYDRRHKIPLSGATNITYTMARVEVTGRRTVRTMCPMNCHPTFCGMLIDVEDGRVVGVRGDRDDPDSRGFLCHTNQYVCEAMLG